MHEKQIPYAHRDYWSERAAILEYDAGFPRAKAEQLALAMLRLMLSGAAYPDTPTPPQEVTRHELFN